MSRWLSIGFALLLVWRGAYAQDDSDDDQWSEEQCDDCDAKLSIGQITEILFPCLTCIDSDGDDCGDCCYYLPDMYQNECAVRWMNGALSSLQLKNTGNTNYLAQICGVSVNMMCEEQQAVCRGKRWHSISHNLTTFVNEIQRIREKCGVECIADEYCQDCIEELIYPENFTHPELPATEDDAIPDDCKDCMVDLTHCMSTDCEYICRCGNDGTCTVDQFHYCFQCSVENCKDLYLNCTDSVLPGTGLIDDDKCASDAWSRANDGLGVPEIFEDALEHLGMDCDTFCLYTDMNKCIDCLYASDVLKYRLVGNGCKDCISHLVSCRDRTCCVPPGLSLSEVGKTCGEGKEPVSFEECEAAILNLTNPLSYNDGFDDDIQDPFVLFEVDLPSEPYGCVVYAPQNEGHLSGHISRWTAHFNNHVWESELEEAEAMVEFHNNNPKALQIQRVCNTTAECLPCKREDCETEFSFCSGAAYPGGSPVCDNLAWDILVNPTSLTVDATFTDDFRLALARCSIQCDIQHTSEQCGVCVQSGQLGVQQVVALEPACKSCVSKFGRCIVVECTACLVAYTDTCFRCIQKKCEPRFQRCTGVKLVLTPDGRTSTDSEGFTFDKCDGGEGSFAVMIEDRHVRKWMGNITEGQVDLEINFTAVHDLDLQVYDLDETSQYDEGYAILAWCDRESSPDCNLGLSSSRSNTSIKYKDMWFTYSGYDGYKEWEYPYEINPVDEYGDVVPLDNLESSTELEIKYNNGYNGTVSKRPRKGYEYVRITGATTTNIGIMAYGYESGAVSVTYRWDRTSSACCDGFSRCEGEFSHAIHKGETTTVGVLPAGKIDVEITLRSENDVDLQLFDMDDNLTYPEGRAIIAYCSAKQVREENCNKGYLGNNRQMDTYEHFGLIFEYSGYNGVDGSKGHEYVKITGTTTTRLLMRAYGAQQGVASVVYTWFEIPPTASPTPF